MFSERAFAKLNLVLHVGAPRADGLHPVCSLIASIDLADEVHAMQAAADSVDCPGVNGPNLAAAAIAAYRARVPSLPPIAVRIVKRIPVAAGLAGGSADAAAVLRAANRIAGEPLDTRALRGLAGRLGSDVPGQVEPTHALVRGVGEIVEPVELPPLGALLVPQRGGLATAAVYAQLDRMQAWRGALDPEPVRGAARALARPATRSAVRLENDLQPAALALRPELTAVLHRLQTATPLAALVSGSGPTCFALFPDGDAAEAAAANVLDPSTPDGSTPDPIVARLRRP